MARKKKHQAEGVSMTQETDTKELETIETELDTTRLELERVKKELEEMKKFPASFSEKQVTVGNHSASLKEKIAIQKAYDNELVKGKFINRRAPGMAVKLPYIKYEDDPVKWWNFFDGGIYTIPRGFADQINEHYYTPHFIQKSGEEAVLTGDEAAGEASMIAEVDTSNKKYAFIPLNF